ncbi:MAG: hypothetical protein IPI87_19815 [Betaproteobacteria bacterium]|nr:hypothetical protein [Betaproteobacteria bacterium]
MLERVDRLVDRPALVARRPVRGWVALEIHFSRASAEEARARAAAAAAGSSHANATGAARDAPLTMPGQTGVGPRPATCR